MPVIIAIVVFIAVFLGAFAAFSYLDQRSVQARALRERLANVEPAAQRQPVDDLALLRDEMLSEMPSIDRVLRSSGRVSAMQKLLSQIGLKFGTGNFLLLCVTASFALGALILVWSKAPVVAWVGPLVEFFLPWALLVSLIAFAVFSVLDDRDARARALRKHFANGELAAGLVPIAVLTEDPRRHILLQNGVEAKHVAEIAFTDVRFSVNAPDPITPQIESRRVKAVIVDLRPENEQLTSHALGIIRMTSPDCAIFVRLDKYIPADTAPGVDLWADEYLDRTGRDDIQCAFENFLRSRRQSRQRRGGRRRPPWGLPPASAIPVHSPGDIIRISQSRYHRWPANWTLASATDSDSREACHGRIRQLQAVESEASPQDS
jgi:hypothetical protein